MLAAAMIAGQVALTQPVKVESRHVDISPLAVSLLKDTRVDLRHPTGFDGVYEFSKVDALGRGENLFMRIDGALTAVFPRSVYVPTEVGEVPDIPPGTVFHIGPIREKRKDPRPRPESMVDTRTTSEPPAAPTAAVIGSTSLITDELYRQRRVEALLRFAARE